MSALLGTSLLSFSGDPGRRKRHLPPDLAEILKRMSEASNHLNTLSADLAYTKVTVVVDDKSTQTGQFFYRKSRPPDFMIEFKNPDAKTLVVKKNKAEMYLPKINQIQEYDLGQHAELVQQFLLLGFGGDVSRLQKDYNVKLTGEEELSDDTTAVLELTPHKESLASRLPKVQLWISEESWLPLQQKFFEPSGDYAVARYTEMRVNRQLASGTFEIHAKGAKRVKMQ
jgi:outer membrane lipoprotein-sorting protein